MLSRLVHAQIEVVGKREGDVIEGEESNFLFPDRKSWCYALAFGLDPTAGEDDQKHRCQSAVSSQVESGSESRA
jgi:hypothetical protein